MTDGLKRTGGKPDFDTDKAWDRFEKLTAQEPVPAFWRQAEQHTHEKDGVVEMKKTEDFQVKQGQVSSTGTASAGTSNVANGTWRTEKPSKRRFRRLAAGVATAAAAIGLITTPLGDQAMAAMMQTFRIQHMIGVGISADDMASIATVLEHGSPDGERSFNLAQYGSLTQSGGGNSTATTWEDAQKRMGAPLLQLDNATAPSLHPATTLTFNLNVEAVNRLLTRFGSTTTLPAEADGKAIKLHIPDGVSTEGTLSGKPVRMMQFGKPELTMENGIDAATVREAILGLPVLPENLRTKLAAIGDWQNTLPVPAKDGMSTTLQLNGHDAVMTLDEDNDRNLLWINGDRMGLLVGNVKDFPTESAFKQAAEELVQR